MRESRLSGSVEGVMGNHDSYSDSGSNPILKGTLELTPQVPHVGPQVITVVSLLGPPDSGQQVRVRLDLIHFQRQLL